jgi:hypothetical protein
MHVPGTGAYAAGYPHSRLLSSPWPLMLLLLLLLLLMMMMMMMMMMASRSLMLLTRSVSLNDYVDGEVDLVYQCILYGF